jgi:hypothetical protein
MAVVTPKMSHPTTHSLNKKNKVSNYISIHAKKNHIMMIGLQLKLHKRGGGRTNDEYFMQ